MKKYLACVILIVSNNLAVFAGGGWSNEKGHCYAKVGQNVIIADQFFALNGDIIDITTISLYTSSFYGEVGITNKLTGIVYLPFFVRSTLNDVERRQSGTIEPGDAINSVGDTDLSLKYQIYKNKNVAIAGSFMLGLPIGNTAKGNTNSGEPRILQTGDGEFNQMILIEASHSFYPKKAYATLGAGFNNRTQGFSDEIRFLFELGIGIGERSNLALKLYNINSLKNGDPGGGAGSGVFGNNVEYLSITPEYSYLLKKGFGFSLSIGTAPYAKNLLAAPNFGMGFYKQF